SRAFFHRVVGDPYSPVTRFEAVSGGGSYPGATWDRTGNEPEQSAAVVTRLRPAALNVSWLGSAFANRGRDMSGNGGQRPRCHRRVRSATPHLQRVHLRGWHAG